jgi:transglutaminase-like putative cysteine protease
MTPEGSRLSDYLAVTEIVDADHPAIKAKARSVVRSTETDVDQARRLFTWVRDEIPHSKDIGVETVTCRASEVLEHRTGICYAKSHLLAALLRSVGIPAGFCYQLLCKDPPHTGMELHGFNGIYLKSLGKWVGVDARGNTGSIDAQFNIQQPQLAFPVDSSKGEKTYETIFAAPDSGVVDTLQRFSSLSEMWPRLPKSLSRVHERAREWLLEDKE